MAAHPRQSARLSTAWTLPQMRALTRFFVGVTLVRLSLGVAGALGASTPYTAVQMLLAVDFFAVGAFLILASTGDAASRSFGLVLLLSSSPWSAGAIGMLDERIGLGSFYPTLTALRPEALVAYFAWRFAAEYPRPGSGHAMSVLLAAGERIALTVVTALLVGGVSSQFPALTAVTVLLGPDHDNSLYWVIWLATTLAAFAVLAVKMLSRTLVERRRARTLVYGFAMAVVPFAAQVTARRLIPSYGALTAPSVVNVLTAWVVLGLLALAPLVAAYAVLVEQALALRVVMSGLVRLALARGALVAVRIIPMVGAAAFLFWVRHQTLTSVLSDPGYLLGLMVVGSAWFGCRAVARAMEAHVLPRPDGDAIQAARSVSSLAKDLQTATDLEQLQAVLTTHLEPALRIDSSHLLVTDDDGRFGSPAGTARPLPVESVVPVLLRGMDGIVDVWHIAPRLSDQDRLWLTDAAVSAMAPLKTSRGDLAGILCLGATTMDLPVSSGDLVLAGAAAQALAPAVERLRFPPTPTVRTAYEDPPEGAECLRCGLVLDGGSSCCPCGGTVRPSLPVTVAGRYRLLRRLGEGASAVTYLALDLELDRQIAVKALPPVDLRAVALFRREAKAMAGLNHPGLATLYGTEFLRGRPLLLMEYLAGGTLGQRLARGPLSSAEWLRLATAVLEAVEYLHAKGLVHGDIAARNVAFTTDQQPKLIDFGLAQATSFGSSRSGALIERDDSDLLALLRSCLPDDAGPMAQALDHREMPAVREQLKLVTRT